MTSVVGSRLASAYSNLLPEERLSVDVSTGGTLYVQPRINAETNEFWFPVVELEHCTYNGLFKILAPCAATACGTPSVVLLSELCADSKLSLWIEHKVHGDPGIHVVKNTVIRQVTVVTLSDIHHSKAIR